MSDLLGHLDAPAPADGDGDWNLLVGRSLAVALQDPETIAATASRLGKDRSWALLGWVENKATVLASGEGATVVSLALDALRMIATSGAVDRREVLVVLQLLKRGGVLADVDVDGVLEGTRTSWEPAGLTDELLAVPSDLPPTHEEVRTGKKIRFVRRASSFDVEDLKRRLGLPTGGSDDVGLR